MSRSLKTPKTRGRRAQSIEPAQKVQKQPIHEIEDDESVSVSQNHAELQNKFRINRASEEGTEIDADPDQSTSVKRALSSEEPRSPQKKSRAAIRSATPETVPPRLSHKANTYKEDDNDMHPDSYDPAEGSSHPQPRFTNELLIDKINVILEHSGFAIRFGIDGGEPYLVGKTMHEKFDQMSIGDSFSDKGPASCSDARAQSDLGEESPIGKYEITIPSKKKGYKEVKLTVDITEDDNAFLEATSDKVKIIQGLVKLSKLNRYRYTHDRDLATIRKL